MLNVGAESAPFLETTFAGLSLAHSPDVSDSRTNLASFVSVRREIVTRRRGSEPDLEPDLEPGLESDSETNWEMAYTHSGLQDIVPVEIRRHTIPCRHNLPERHCPCNSCNHVEPARFHTVLALLEHHEHYPRPVNRR